MSGDYLTMSGTITITKSGAYLPVEEQLAYISGQLYNIGGLLFFGVMFLALIVILIGVSTILSK